MKYPNSTLSRMLKAKYFRYTDFLHAEIGSVSSGGWRSVLEGRKVIEKGLLWKIGSDTNVRIFHDPWLPPPVPFNVPQNALTIPPDLQVYYVSALLYPDRSWNRNLIEEEDEVNWCWTKSGIYEVGLRYKIVYGFFHSSTSLRPQNIHNRSEIEALTTLIQPMNYSSKNLARFINSSLNATNISFSDIKTKVAPLLFESFETVPQLAQISYIGMEGYFFSFYNGDHGQPLAIYSNRSTSSSIISKHYYVQPVNPDNGKLYGNATIFDSYVNTTWVGEALNGSNDGFVTLEKKLSNDQEFLFISSSRITKTGSVISLGVQATKITDFFFSVISHHQGAMLYLATKDGQVLQEGIKNTHMIVSKNDTVSFQYVNNHTSYYQGSVTCKNDGEVVASTLKIQGVEYLMRCSSIQIMGIKLVYVVGVPKNGAMISFIKEFKRYGLMVLSAMVIMSLIGTISIVIMKKALKKQKEATEEADRKSKNKSIAFATACHDVRASLAALTGLIELSSSQLVPSSSELNSNLKQMDSYTKDLLGMLNSILDASKIEAGEMQLEEEEFDVFQFLEEVVDSYHNVAMKKGVDIVLEPFNDSVHRYSHTKGDRVKLKRVLCNLLDNAVKFTDEGHIAVRVRAQKPALQNSMSMMRVTNQNRPWSCLFIKRKNNERRNDDDIEASNSTQPDPSNTMDFIFEVEDTGKGIPKDKHESVFENYVQVKETAIDHGGTGLGLGSVRSLVRLMHGDIRIVEKDNGGKGTCFRFNVHLTVCDKRTDDITRESESKPVDRTQSHRSTIHATSSGSSMCSLSPKLPICGPSTFRHEGSRVVLLIQGEERRRATQRFIERKGIKVKVVKQWTNLSHTLNKIKKKGLNSLSSGSSSSSATHGSTNAPLSVSMDEIESTQGFILIVIDAKAGPFQELCRVVSEFKRGICVSCRVVWLENPISPNLDFNSLNEDDYDPNDIVLHKPLHGTSLFQVLSLLPEYGDGSMQRAELEKCGTSRSRSGKEPQQSIGDQSHDQGGTKECEVPRSSDKPLSGKRIMVVEDDNTIRKIASASLEQLGASVEKCENGEQAVELVKEGLARDFPNLPYDYIFMDCQMPVMNGYEATRLIREIEKEYNIHIPIFALTANTQEEANPLEAGMDHHLVKPIDKKGLLEAITKVHDRVAISE
ncbi:histidine kinase CKI1-like [Arachis hypogaea]|uniref:histidine kinase CKI1-like n=1 Tax=Arachis hypogaea TaxID=3818 RepID=UPI000DEC8D94|nr:histidine kinase CKI1-like [Arachis hypogaea]